MANNFEVGDIVRKASGTKHIRVNEVFGNCVCGKYIDSGASTGRMRLYGLVKVDNDMERKGNFNMKGKLFQTKEETPRFGVGLAVNSSGKYVLEMKGTSELEIFDKKQVEVVMPFTYGVKFNGAGTEYAYLGKEGTVEIGDLLLKTDGTKGITIGQVTAVNTKSEKANKYFDGVKIKTEQLDQ